MSLEIKKSYKASLEGMRPAMFMLGLIVVLSVLFVALEFNTGNDSSDYSGSMLDDIPQEMELMPAVQHDEQEVMAQAAGVSQAVKEIYNVVPDNVTVDTEERGAEKVSGNVVETDAERDNATPVQVTPVDNSGKTLDFRVVERLPEFPGGMVEFMKWLTKNLKYPVVARDQKIQGKVIVSFIINKDGGVADAKVVRQVHPYLDREAMRVIRMMPRWKPGEDKGKPCRTMMVIPVVFAL